MEKRGVGCIIILTLWQWFDYTVPKQHIWPILMLTRAPRVFRFIPCDVEDYSDIRDRPSFLARTKDIYYKWKLLNKRGGKLNVFKRRIYECLKTLKWSTIFLCQCAVYSNNGMYSTVRIPGLHYWVFTCIALNIIYIHFKSLYPRAHYHTYKVTFL